MWGALIFTMKNYFLMFSSFRGSHPFEHGQWLEVAAQPHVPVGDHGRRRRRWSPGHTEHRFDHTDQHVSRFFLVFFFFGGRRQWSEARGERPPEERRRNARGKRRTRYVKNIYLHILFSARINNINKLLLY
jgi:hypothetical protein